MRASRFDSELMSSAICLRFSSVSAKAGHQLARTLDGGKRRAHFVSDEVHGLLIALARGQFRAPVAAHHQVVIAAPAHRKLSELTAAGVAKREHPAGA